MRFECLASSSAGNCYWLELDRSSGKPFMLMLECGIPYKEILQKLQFQVSSPIDISTCDAVIVTHNHGDHCKAAADLAKRGFKVFGNATVCSNPATYCEPYKTKVIAPDTFIDPFIVKHDAPDPYGYLIRTDLETVLFVADCKYWTVDWSSVRLDYVIIESNYDGSVIHFALENAKEANDASKIEQYERVLKSHMSLKNCIAHLKKLDLSGCKSIFLIHLSDRHANENVFKAKVAEATAVPTYVCKKNGGII